jgi:DNA-binding NarL/FixJ family response regulator
VLFAEGLGILLDAEDDLVVVGLAHHSNQAIQTVVEHRPAVLVLDAHLSIGDLAQTVATARAASPTTRLLVLSDDVRPETTAAVLAAGADGCLTKDRSSRQLAAAIRKLAAGERAVARAAASAPVRDPSVELRVRTLTSREREVLGLLTCGLATRRIAQELRLTYHTVRTHIRNLLIKLGVHSQLEAVHFALEHAVVEARGSLARERRSA